MPPRLKTGPHHVAQTRITAGDWRGRVVSTPSGREVRPTRAMVRQSVYDILGTRVVGARVLDLYAGAGTVGFEALSRGAATATFVERHREALALIAKTAERFGCSDRCTLVGADVRRWLRGASAQTEEADLCYVDAPYQDPELESVLELLGATTWRLPRWLDARLPTINIEGTDARTSPAPATRGGEEAAEREPART